MTENSFQMLNDNFPSEHQRYNCECGRSYSHKGDLVRHKRLECGKEPQFKCPYCPKRCKRKYHLQSHIVNVHKDKLNLKNTTF